MKNLKIINEKEIPKEIYNEANFLCKGIDENDTLFVACAIFCNAKLWTNDKKLIKGLIFFRSTHSNPITLFRIKIL
jgi:predicted nucleic acid-binding protein